MRGDGRSGRDRDDRRCRGRGRRVRLGHACTRVRHRRARGRRGSDRADARPETEGRMKRVAAVLARRSRRLPRCRGARRRGGARLHLDRDVGRTRPGRPHRPGAAGRRPAPRAKQHRPRARDRGLRRRAISPLRPQRRRLSQRAFAGHVPEPGAVRRRRRPRIGVGHCRPCLGARLPRALVRLARSPDPLDEPDRPAEGATGARISRSTSSTGPCPGAVGGEPLAISGSLDYEPPPASGFNPVLIAPVVALALAGGVFWWARRRREAA